MQRLTGFIAGVITTTSVAYLTALEFRRNAHKVSTVLQDSKDTLDGVGRPRRIDRRVIELEQRNSAAETIKDLWNDEVVSGVSWLYRVLGYETK